MKRILELTPDQIETILHSLKIAGDSYYSQFEALAKLNNAAPNPDQEAKEGALKVYDKANQFYNLKTDIEGGNFDR